MVVAQTVSSTTALFAGLVDDAGLFPPEQLAMSAAVRRHRADVHDASGMLSQRFICPSGRLAELTDALDPRDRVEVSVIAPLSPDGLESVVRHTARDARLSLAAVEGLAPPDWPSGAARLVDAVRSLPDPVPVFVEVALPHRPVQADIDSAVTSLAAAGLAAKLRCGGVRADLFPSIDVLAALVGRCVEHGVAFKATAGLHHAVRHRDRATGFTHFGFLNLLLAVARAAAGQQHTAIAAALTSRDPAELVAEARALDPGEIDRTRTFFVSYGSCSTTEPVEDLRALGLLPPSDAKTEPTRPRVAKEER